MADPMSDSSEGFQVEDGSIVDVSRLSVAGSTRRGATIGLRRTSYVAVPISILAMIPGAVLTLFGLGAGRGWSIGPGFNLPPMISIPIAIYLVLGSLGAIVGGSIGMVRAMMLRARPGSLRAKVWAMANRPIGQKPREAEAPVIAVDPPRGRGPWRWLIGIPSAMLVVLGVLAFGMGVHLGRIVDRRLTEAIAEADLDDPSWRLDDLMAAREVVADAENSAMVVARALQKVPEGWPGPPPRSKGQPRPIARPVEAALGRLALTPENIRMDDPTARTIRDELNALGESVRIARLVANIDRGRHELEIGSSVIDTLLPETQASRTAARLLAADAAIQAHDGDLDGALDSCRATFGVARSIGDEPFLISMLVRVAEGFVAMDSARRVLGQGEPTDQALARLQNLVLDERKQPLLLVGMRGERASLDEIIRRVGSGELSMSSLSGETSNNHKAASQERISSWGKLSFDNQRAIGLEWMNEAVRIAGKPAFARPPLWEALEGKIAEERRKTFFALTSTIPVLLMPALRPAETAQTRYEAALGAMELLLASERHRRKTGDWPGSIEAIAPGILTGPPLDPFSGQPYHLERRDGQFWVNSVGPNLQDDHGPPSDPKSSKPGVSDDIGFMAWDVTRRGLMPGATPVGDTPK